MLTKPHPNVITTKLICLACGGQMPLKLIEPAYDGKPTDTHVFACRAIGRPIAMKSPKRVLKAFSRINVPGDRGLGRGNVALLVV